MGTSVREESRGRVIDVAVVDAAGQSLQGVKVAIKIRGVSAGSFVTDAYHTAGSFEIHGEAMRVELVASYGQQQLTAPMRKEFNSHTFAFAVLPYLAVAQTVAVARCPDGTTGTPCVTCVVGDIRVRICV